MIELLFHFAGDPIFVRVDGHNVLFGNAAQGPMIAPIQNLKLDRAGVVKEFPDLKDNPDWAKISIQRFKDKIKSFKSENAVCNYIISDLQKFGYEIKYRQVAGHRPERVKVCP